ncbi:MAG: DNA internalization-related competence protein ComEC/Rec2 [Burkholderiaceae bacterium]|nr:DNA internalization-related competence protein ComEC/Rec2 [Burkholderiaceae bacterium]
MLLAPLAAFVLGVCALQWQAQLPPPVMLLLATALALAAGGAALARRAAPHAFLALACSGMFAAGFASAGWHAHWRLADELPAGDEMRDVVVTGVVASLPMRLERGVRFEFTVESHAADVEVPGRVLLAWYTPGEPVQPGERWRFVVRLKRPHGALNPAGFDVEAWLLERDLRATGYVRAGSLPPPQRLQAMVWRPALMVERSRAWLRDRLLATLQTQPYGGVLLALVLGDQRAISREHWTLFNRTGIAHLVSISGLHITMIAALAGAVAGGLWRRVPALLQRAPAQTAGVLSGLVAALLYALLAGWGVPAQRTVLMLACVAAAWLWRRRMTPGVALAMAAAVVSAWDPWAVTAAGFWLSFGAVAAIVWVVQGRPAGGGRWTTALRTAVHVQLAVTLALVPATVMLFQQVSLVAPLANALAIPLVSWVVTPLALAGAAIAALPQPLALLAVPLFDVAHAVFAGLATVLGQLAQPAWAAVAVPAPPPLLGALAVAGVAWLLAPPGWPLRRLGVVALLPLAVWPGERPGAGELWVAALDVGQGTAVVLETRSATWVYDTGPGYTAESDAGERVVLPYLRSRGIAALDGLVVSHLDRDHSGGAASILRGIEVRQRLTSIDPGHAVLAGFEAERCEAGQVIASGELTLQVLHPTRADYARRRPTNAMSCVVLARAGDAAVLLTGDIPATDEAALAAREPGLRAEWMLMPHHGSNSSSSRELLERVRPQVSVAQAGYRNRFGHPDARVLARHADAGIAVVRTDHAGAAQWRFAPGRDVELRAWRVHARRYWHHQPASTGDDEEDGWPAAGSDGGELFLGMP